MHSGSRGVGDKVAQHHRDLAYRTQGTPEFGASLRDLQWAQRFALNNRTAMMDRLDQTRARVRAGTFPGTWGPLVHRARQGKCRQPTDTATLDAGDLVTVRTR